MDIPVIMSSAGAQPQSATSLQTQLITAVAATNPGYTANLPGSLIEDISSTDVGAIALCDSAYVETINSLTPYGANNFLLNQLGSIYLGQLYGAQGAATTNSAYVIFSGVPGYIISSGFIVSDGTYQYSVVDGGVIGSGGQTAQLFCLATQSGTWAIPANSITTLVTSFPSANITSVTNPLAGVQGVGAETEGEYRARILQAGIASSQGMATYLKTLLNQISGVQPRLVSVLQNSPGWEIICGGGDQYQIAYAIYSALFDISTLTGSKLSVSGITQANPGVVTTNLAHGLVTGSTQTLTGIVGMTALNGVPVVVTALTPTTFSIGLNTSSYGAYVSGGALSPNPRNITATINDYPNIYLIPFVNPPLQTVGLTVLWNTTGTNLVANSAVSQLAQQPLADYINGIYVGQPINIFEMQNVFQSAIASVIPPTLLSRIVFSVTINGVLTSPSTGTGLIVGDPESYFETSLPLISISRG